MQEKRYNYAKKQRKLFNAILCMENDTFLCIKTTLLIIND